MTHRKPHSGEGVRGRGLARTLAGHFIDRRRLPSGGFALVVLFASLTLCSAASAGTSVALFNRFSYTDLTSPTNAAKYRFMVLGYGAGARSQAAVRSLIASIHGSDPQARILLYKDYTVAPSDPQGIGGCAPYNASLPHGGVPLSWFLLTPGGAPMWNARYATYELDPGNPQVQQACLASAVSMAKLAGYDGVFWDSEFTSLFWARLSPRNCISATCQSNANFHAAMNSWVTAVSAGLHANGLLSFGNIGGANASSYFGGGPTYWAAFQQEGFDGALEESFTSGTNRLPIPFAEWKLELANEAWSEANGKYMLANADVGANRALNVYGLATMLLAAGGYSSWDTGSGNYFSGEYWFPEYDTALGLGAPLGPYSVQSDGLYVRLFQGGTVVVNPTTGPVADPVYGTLGGQSALILGPGAFSGRHGSGGGSRGTGAYAAAAARGARGAAHRHRQRATVRRHGRRRHRSVSVWHSVG